MQTAPLILYSFVGQCGHFHCWPVPFPLAELLSGRGYLPFHPPSSSQLLASVFQQWLKFLPAFHCHFNPSRKVWGNHKHFDTILSQQLLFLWNGCFGEKRGFALCDRKPILRLLGKRQLEGREELNLKAALSLQSKGLKANLLKLHPSVFRYIYNTTLSNPESFPAHEQSCPFPKRFGAKTYRNSLQRLQFS